MVEKWLTLKAGDHKDRRPQFLQKPIFGRGIRPPNYAMVGGNQGDRNERTARADLEGKGLAGVIASRSEQLRINRKHQNHSIRQRADRESEKSKHCSDVEPQWGEEGQVRRKKESAANSNASSKPSPKRRALKDINLGL